MGASPSKSATQVQDPERIKQTRGPTPRTDLAGLPIKGGGSEFWINDIDCNDAPRWCSKKFGAQWSASPYFCSKTTNGVYGAAARGEYECALLNPVTNEDMANCCTSPGSAAKCGYGSYVNGTPTCNTFMSTYCSDLKNFTSEACTNFCQVNATIDPNGEGTAKCYKTAVEFCKKNKKDKRCECINYTDSSAWSKLKNTVGSKNTTILYNNYQCWAPACVGIKDWSTTFSNPGVACNGTVTICNQKLEVKNITAESVGTIGSSCNASSQSDSTVVEDDTEDSSPDYQSPSAPSAPSAPSDKPKPPDYTYYYYALFLILCSCSFFIPILFLLILR
jgi:hypothetical protein